MLEVFQDLIGNYPVVYQTVDVVPGGTFTEDGFSDEFVAKHAQEYDIVFLPDCGGEWFHAQNVSNNIESQTIANTLCRLMCQAAKTVKNGGRLLAGKFLRSDARERVVLTLNSVPGMVAQEYVNSNSDTSVLVMISGLHSETNIDQVVPLHKDIDTICRPLEAHRQSVLASTDALQTSAETKLKIQQICTDLSNSIEQFILKLKQV